MCTFKVCVLKKIGFRINWEVIKRAQPIADGNNPVCRLCLKESTAVMYALKKEGCLNKRSKFISSCRHIKKLLLKYKNFEVFYSYLTMVFVNFRCLIS